MINPADDINDDDEVKEVKPYQPIYANISEVIKCSVCFAVEI